MGKVIIEKLANGEYRWESQTLWLLRGTYIELVPEYMTGAWFIIDSRDPDYALGKSLKLTDARKKAVQILKTRPDLRKEES